MSVERESRAIKQPVDGRGGERGQAPERLGRPEPQQKVQESLRRLRIEGLEKGAPPIFLLHSRTGDKALSVIEV